MKCAVQICGQPRNVRECYQNIYNNIILPNEADVFLHSWIDPNMYGKQYIANWVKREAILVQKDDPNKQKYCDIASNPIPSDIDHIMIDLYHPKKFVFEKPKIFNYDKILDNKRSVYLDPQDSLSFFYSVYMSNQQRLLYQYENNFLYDKIIRIRFDNIFEEPLLFKNLDTNNKIYIPPDYNDPKWSDHNPKELGISDRWCIADNYLMNVYTELYLHIENLVKNGETIVCNELMIGYWIRKKMNIPIQRLYHPYYIKRI